MMTRPEQLAEIFFLESKNQTILLMGDGFKQERNEAKQIDSRLSV